MELKRIESAGGELFCRAFSLYESAFPYEERRDIIDQKKVMSNPDYHFCAIVEENNFQGIMLYWQIGDMIYLEHFATLPELRGQGIGASALELLKAEKKDIILEIEPPVDELTKRRYGFYCRNGFCMAPYYHVQAKYHVGDPDMELKILCCPGVISETQYRAFYDYLIREIGVKCD